MSACSKEDTQKCIPCQRMDSNFLLSKDKIEKSLESYLKLWKLNETDEKNMICRSFVAKDFLAAMDAVNRMGKIAERENHHPDLHITNYREVRVDLWTHKVGGITQNDLDFAKIVDKEVKVSYSPKWLKCNPEAQATALE